jgi:hypothetical protein
MMTKKYVAEQIFSSEKGYEQQRQHTRYRPTLNTTAQIDIYGGDNEFTHYTTGLVTEESFKGARVVVTNNEYWVEGAKIKIKMGENKTHVKAEIRWMKQIDFNTIVLGLQLLDD